MRPKEGESRPTDKVDTPIITPLYPSGVGENSDSCYFDGTVIEQLSRACMNPVIRLGRTGEVGLSG